MYLTRHLVARSEMFHLGEQLKPGDKFMATEVDANYFIARGRADEDKEDFVAQTFDVEASAEAVMDEASVEAVETVEPVAPVEEPLVTPVEEPVVAVPARRRGRPRTVKADE